MISVASPPSAILRGPGIYFTDRTWEDYQQLLRWRGDSHFRITYSEGMIELMTLSFEHELWSGLLGQLVEALTLVLKVPRQACGSTTFRREDLARGLEPDRCYYLENEPRIRGKLELDLSVDPPPDLAIEVEISRSAINRLSIYAALGVPEVWRFNGTDLTMHRLSSDTAYTTVERSGHFPLVPIEEFERFLHRRGHVSEVELIEEFIQWVRSMIACNWKPTQNA